MLAKMCEEEMIISKVLTLGCYRTSMSLMLEKATWTPWLSRNRKGNMQFIAKGFRV